jgi:hypothetical protein
VKKKSLKKTVSFASLIVLLGVIMLAFVNIPQDSFGAIDASLFKLDNFSSEKSLLEVKAGEPVCDYQDTLEYYYYRETADLWESNNKFGLYIYSENRDFFELAQELVNSNGGDWGYVLIPYNVATDRDYAKWERVFEQLRNKHLIPVVQLWAVEPANYKKQTQEAAEFLNSFIWPIKDRYVSVYNEPNDSKFWYGYVDPAEYAKVLDYTIDTFKSANPGFFMLNGALNTSAPTDSNHMDAFAYMRAMQKEIPDVFDKLDGWASHSYPQPNFSGNPHAVGRWSIRAYETELDYLYDVLGVEKELPVFITETGWAHAEGENYNASYLNVEQVAENFKVAYQEIWLPDDRVRAVMPFTIWYNPPFDHFSWVNKDKVPYLHYDVVKGIKKIDGEPPHLEVSNIPVSCE